MPVEGVERHPCEQELTFVRMFSESNEQSARRRTWWSERFRVNPRRKGPGDVGRRERRNRAGSSDDIWVKVRMTAKKVGFTATKTCKPSASIERARRTVASLFI